MSDLIKSNGHASDLFVKHLMGGGSSYIECSCGITHYAIDNKWESLEWVEDAKNHAKNSPKNVKLHEFDAIEYKSLNGLTFVLDCDLCMTKLAKYEDFIWEERNAIREFLKARIDKEFEWASQEKLLNEMSGIK